jgi:hypothetical protein
MVVIHRNAVWAWYTESLFVVHGGGLYRVRWIDFKVPIATFLAMHCVRL